MKIQLNTDDHGDGTEALLRSFIPCTWVHASRNQALPSTATSSRNWRQPNMSRTRLRSPSSANRLACRVCEYPRHHHHASEGGNHP